MMFIHQVGLFCSISVANDKLIFFRNNNNRQHSQARRRSANKGSQASSNNWENDSFDPWDISRVALFPVQLKNIASNKHNPTLLQTYWDVTEIFLGHSHDIQIRIKDETRTNNMQKHLNIRFTTAYMRIYALIPNSKMLTKKNLFPFTFHWTI